MIQKNPSHVGPGTPAAPTTSAETSLVDIAANATARVVFEVPETTGEIRARLGDDTLAFDNEVTLLPPVEKIVRVDVDVADDYLRRNLVDAHSIRATGLAARSTNIRPDLIVTDHPRGTVPSKGVWRLGARYSHCRRCQTFRRPVRDRPRFNALTKGMGLRGCRLGHASQTSQQNTTGGTVLAAGNTPLLTDTPHPGGGHDLWLEPPAGAFHAPGNTQLAHPLVEPAPVVGRVGAGARPQQRPPRRRCESNTCKSVPSVTVTASDGQSQILPAGNGRVTIKGDLPGVYTILAGTQRSAFAVNPLNRDESDLASAVTGQWGQWEASGKTQSGYREVAWLILLLALGGHDGSHRECWRPRHRGIVGRRRRRLGERPVMTLIYPIWLLLLIPFAAAAWYWPLPTPMLACCVESAILLIVLALAGLAVRLPSRAGTVVVVADRSRPRCPAMPTRVASAR